MADTVRAKYPHLDILINSVEISNPNGPHLAINCLSTFLLTVRLLPLFKASKGQRPSRIENVASAGQSSIDFNDVMLERDYRCWLKVRADVVMQIVATGGSR